MPGRATLIGYEACNVPCLMRTRQQSSVLLSALVWVTMGGCSSGTDAPAVSAVAPLAVCGGQLTTRVTVSSTGPALPPPRSVAEDPDHELVVLRLRTHQDGSGGSGARIGVPGAHVRLGDAGQVAFDVFPGMDGGHDLSPGLYDVSIQSAQGVRGSLGAAVYITAPPSVKSATENVLCDAQGAITVVVEGSDFATLDGEVPRVIFTPAGGQGGAVELLATSADLCTTPAAPAGVALATCTRLTVKVPLGALQPGSYQVAVRNPRDTGCTSVEDVRLFVVAPPVLKTVSANPVCAQQQDNLLTLSGEGFVKLDGTMPRVRFVSVATGAPPIEFPAASIAGCTASAGPKGVDLSLCQTLTVNVPRGALPAGSYQVAVKNPQATACISAEDVRAAVAPAPQVGQITLGAVCTAQADSTVRVSGTGFLVSTDNQGAHGPAATINGMPFASTATDCATLPDAAGTQTCNTLLITVPKSSLAVGTYPLSINNPAPAACHTEMMLQLGSVPPPILASAQPQRICVGGGSLTLAGQNFRDGAAAIVNGFSSSRSTVPAGGQSGVFDFAGGMKGGGPFDVSIQNVDGCQSSLPAKITVVPGPSIITTDPQVLPASVTTTVYAYVISTIFPVQSVKLSVANKNNYNITLPSSIDPVHPGRVALTTSGLAAGDYDMMYVDQNPCPALLPNALKVRDTADNKVLTIAPATSSAAADTTVTLTGAGFAATPWIYLSPVGGGQAVVLSGVVWKSATRLLARVAAGAAAGTYDVVAVNPDGTYGILAAGYTQTAAGSPTPVVTAVNPGSVVNGVTTTVTFAGSAFRAPTVTLTCQDKDGNAAAGATATVKSTSPTSLSVDVAPAGTVCIARVINSDGTFFDYSALGVTNASLDLVGFQAGPSLTSARRSPAVVAARPTPDTRYVYAFGGDTGADNAPLDTVEAAKSGINGKLDNFSLLSPKLPAARSWGSAVNLGRFIYLVSGYTGTGATSTAYRTQMLNTTGVPQGLDVDYQYDPASGLNLGTYLYRISAVLSSNAVTEPGNPGGETLAGSPFAVRVQKVNGKLKALLTFSTMPTAVSYRIYRTPAADAAEGTEVLLATVPAGASPMQYLDDGSVAPAGAGPLPEGSLGVWRSLPSMNTARMGSAVVMAQDPSNSSLSYLYVMGGAADPNGLGALTSVEFLPITVALDGSQSFGVWTNSKNSLPTNRFATQAFVTTSAGNSSLPAGATYLFIPVGSTGAGLRNQYDKIFVASIPAGGQPSTFTTIGYGAPSYPCYGSALVNNRLYLLGGFSGTTGNVKSLSAKILTGKADFDVYSSLASGTLTTGRALQGTTQESAFIYQLGGAGNGINTALSNVEFTVF